MINQRMVSLGQAKLFLRINNAEFDMLLNEMIDCAEAVAKLYIEPAAFEKNLSIISQGILAHVALMFDSGYVSSTLPGDILQYYKPFIKPRL